MRNFDDDLVRKNCCDTVLKYCSCKKPPFATRRYFRCFLGGKIRSKYCHFLLQSLCEVKNSLQIYNRYLSNFVSNFVIDEFYALLYTWKNFFVPFFTPGETFFVWLIIVKNTCNLETTLTRFQKWTIICVEMVTWLMQVCSTPMFVVLSFQQL